MTLTRPERRALMFPKGRHFGSSKNTTYHKGCFGWSRQTKPVKAQG